MADGEITRGQAEQIVETVLNNLRGRAGIGDELDMIDDEVRAEMIEDCIADVQKLGVW